MASRCRSPVLFRFLKKFSTVHVYSTNHFITVTTKCPPDMGVSRTNHEFHKWLTVLNAFTSKILKITNHFTPLLFLYHEEQLRAVVGIMFSSIDWLEDASGNLT